MLDKKITRKQFLALVTAFVGVAIVHQLPLGIGKKNKINLKTDTDNSYGNQAYGGSKK